MRQISLHRIIIALAFMAMNAIGHGAAPPPMLPAQPFRTGILPEYRPSMGGKGDYAPAPLMSRLALPPRHTVADALPRRIADNVEIYGSVVFTTDFSASRHEGVWRFNTAGDMHPVFPKYFPESHGGVLLYLDGLYYAYYVIYDDSDYFRQYPIFRRKAFDTETWQEVCIPDCELTIGNFPGALCTDGKDVYGWYGSEAPFKFGKLDMATNTWTYIADCTTTWFQGAFGTDGCIYYIAGDNDKEVLHRLDAATGADTAVGPTGTEGTIYTCGLIADRKADKLYRTYFNSVDDGYYGALYEINLLTGHADVLCRFGQNDQITGLYIPGQEGDKVPAPVSGMSAVFPDGALSGSVNFRAPLSYNDSTPATGELTYTISVNGLPAQSGKTFCGRDMSVPLTVDSAGMYTIAVAVANNTGSARSVRKTLFLGNDTPAAPTVEISYTGEGFLIGWNTPSALHNGYLPVDKIRYKVTRYPDATVVARDLAADCLDDPVPYPDTYRRYYYTVEASCNGMTSAPGVSAVVPLGSYRLPYLEPFNNAAALNEFVIVDGNNDRYTWKFGRNYPFVPDTCVCVASGYSTTADDWLISPGVLLEEGKTYNVSADLTSIGGEDNKMARFEILMGTDATPAAMTLPVAKPSIVPRMPTLKSENSVWSFTAPATGSYNIGVHYISLPHSVGMDLDDLRVSLPLRGVPDSVMNLTVTFDDSDGWKATVKGRAPLTDVDGRQLDTIKRIKILREGRKAIWLHNIAPGQEFTYEDRNITPADWCRWNVACENGNGLGKWAQANLYLDDKEAAPSPVVDCSISENSETELRITWTPPATDNAGRPIDVAKLKYIVDVDYYGSLDETKFHTDFGDTCFILTTPASQKRLDVSLTAVNAYGKSEAFSLPTMISGNSYKLPVRETFANKTPSYLYQGGWNVTGNNTGIESVDNDNGFMEAQFYDIGVQADLITGKIDLGTAQKPFLSFYTYNANEVVDDTVHNDLNMLEVYIREVGSGEWTRLLGGTVYDLCGGADSEPGTWGRICVGLEAFKGKKVHLKFTGTCVNFYAMGIDKLTVADEQDCNLGVTVFTVPEKIRLHRPFSLTAKVENRGRLKASDYKVEYYRDRELYKVAPGVELESGESTFISIPDTLTLSGSDFVRTYYAVVRIEGDMDPSDDKSRDVTVSRVYGPKPAPSGLNGTAEGNVVSLNWMPPQISSGYSGSGGVEDFENYTPWTYEDLGDWTFVDVDEKGIGAFVVPDPLFGSMVLDIPNSPLLSRRAFILIRHGFNNGEDFSMFDAHSGEQFLASMTPNNGSPADDWLVSPLLDGNAQTISFFARSFMKDRPEKIEMLYSSTGKNITDFVSVREIASVPDCWTEYKFDIPEGAKYFAVRNKGVGSMLMLDDFRYNVAPVLVDGYMVYRGNVRVNGDMVPAASWTDINCPAGTHNYIVTAIYNDGDESAPSRSCRISSSVGGVAASGITVEAGRGFVEVKGAGGVPVSIVNTASVCCYTAVPQGDVYVRLPAGVYFVKAGVTTVKVIVR